MTAWIDTLARKTIAKLMPEDWEWKVAERAVAPLKAEAKGLRLPLEWPESELNAIARDAESAVREALAESTGIAQREDALRQRAVALAKDGDQADAGDPQASPDEYRLAIEAVVQSHDDGQEGHTERGPHDLLGEEQVRLLIALQRDDRRRAVYHDDAQRDEENGRQKQNAIAFEFYGHFRL